MVNLIVWIILGGIIGWLASLIMRTDAQAIVLLAVVSFFRRGTVR